MYWVIKYFCICFIGNLLKIIFSFFPIRKKTIIFISFSGTKVSCNPYYIYKYIISNNKDFECFWVLNKNIETDSVPMGQILKSHGYEYYKLMFTAGFIITNDRLPSFFNFRKGQTLINTWHGGGAFKRTFGSL